jgi:hypothetical protein
MTKYAFIPFSFTVKSYFTADYTSVSFVWGVVGWFVLLVFGVHGGVSTFRVPHWPTFSTAFSWKLVT